MPNAGFGRPLGFKNVAPRTQPSGFSTWPNSRLRRCSRRCSLLVLTRACIAFPLHHCPQVLAPSTDTYDAASDCAPGWHRGSSLSFLLAMRTRCCTVESESGVHRHCQSRRKSTKLLSLRVDHAKRPRPSLACSALRCVSTRTTLTCRGHSGIGQVRFRGSVKRYLNDTERG